MVDFSGPGFVTVAQSGARLSHSQSSAPVVPLSFDFFIFYFKWHNYILFEDFLKNFIFLA